MAESPSIFISGGSRGIGLGLAQRFHSGGYRVGICGRNETSLARAAETMPGLQTFVCDVSDREAVKQLARDILENMGPPDVLVNNAGTFQPGDIATEPESNYDLMLDTNLASAYFLTRALLPSMRDRASGAILNVCSVASLKAYPAGGMYSISKFALYGFSQNLREELKETGLRVVSLLPGAVYTDSWAESDIDADRLMPVGDVAELVWTTLQLSDRTVVEDLVLRPQLGDL